ncbi:type IV toxin-antitoxin system AbiEi family antitoxin domain-containing protein [Haloplanus pelagicus]|uniref:type IV toxin-antitoxin system AbiEi family antitoxin domain-containing protein n=1 Tax=Haloplanus pelagicus TaxID=2949995 RepID=UPI0031F312F5
MLAQLMRKSASWMVLWDDRLLEIARKEGHVSPKTAEDSGYVHISNAQISRRCSKLADHGLLRRLPNGVYTITQKGEAYLEGELNADKLTEENGNGDTAEA